MLASRLAAVAETLGVTPADTATDVGTLLDDAVAAVQDDMDDSRVWLLLTGLTGAFPTTELVLAARRMLELSGRSEATRRLLTQTAPYAARHGSAHASIRVVTDQVVVDVDFTARTNLLTGIQRVVRETLPRWLAEHDPVPVVWTRGNGCFRSLSPEEDRYLRQWPGHDAREPAAPQDGVELVIPWRTRVVLPEVPFPEHSDRLSALARLSGNPVGLVGYDCIPVVSADLVVSSEREKFGRYLEVVKYADRVAAISESSREEFAGFGQALGAQGLSGPVVSSIPLPNIIEVTRTESWPSERTPVVVCVGTFNDRKNQQVLLDAAEMLWAEGLVFQLLLIGGGGRPTGLFETIDELQKRGRDLAVHVQASDDFLHASYATARFTVFPSLHEGFGLPIVESLSHGVPVITSDYGSMRESAEGQGGLLVDPRSVPELTDAMRTLLTDDERLAALRAEAAARPPRTWDTYAAEVWTELTR